MDDIRLKFYSPIVTGTPGASLEALKQHKQNPDKQSDFQSILEGELEKGGVAFSKHAIKRTVDHSIELTQESLARLNKGVKLAEEKNLDDTLILVDSVAFVVNIRNNTVITAVNQAEMKENVFTNINGTVII